MEKLKKNKIDRYVFNLIENKKPILGICVGCQKYYLVPSEEDGYSEELKIFKEILRELIIIIYFSHVGWNSFVILIKNVNYLTE